MPPHCSETARDCDGRPRHCVLEAGHGGDHLDWRSESWEPPGFTLARLQARWGRTHRVVWTGHMWPATAHDPNADWRTETEPTSQQLEVSLRRHAPRDKHYGRSPHPYPFVPPQVTRDP